jgi:hypothetical protein
MSTPEPDTPVADPAALILGYMLGEVPLATVVAAMRALPSNVSADCAFAIEGQDISPELQDRMDELLRVLRESYRAV